MEKNLDGSRVFLLIFAVAEQFSVVVGHEDVIQHKATVRLVPTPASSFASNGLGPVVVPGPAGDSGHGTGLDRGLGDPDRRERGTGVEGVRRVLGPFGLEASRASIFTSICYFPCHCLSRRAIVLPTRSAQFRPLSAQWAVSADDLLVAGHKPAALRLVPVITGEWNDSRHLQNELFEFRQRDVLKISTLAGAILALDGDSRCLN